MALYRRRSTDMKKRRSRDIDEGSTSGDTQLICQNERIDDSLNNFDAYGGYQSYCSVQRSMPSRRLSLELSMTMLTRPCMPPYPHLGE